MSSEVIVMALLRLVNMKKHVKN